MSYQPDSYRQSEVNAQKAQRDISANQGFQQPYASFIPTQNRSIPETNPYIKYTLLDAIVGCVGALVVLYTQSLAGTFFIFLCAFIAFYRGLRALIFANRHPGTEGHATGIVSIILGGIAISIMIYLFAAVGVQ